jgi:molybdopterin biosynthesis enzyme
MSYFIDDAKKEAESLISEIIDQLNYEDQIILTSGVSLKTKDIMVETIAKKLYDIHMEYYDDEQGCV